MLIIFNLLKKTAIFIALFSVFFIFFSAKAQAASFYFSPSSGSFYKNENFNVSIIANSNTAAINAMSGTIKFPTEYLEAINVNKNGGSSIIDFWVQQPSFSNAGAQGNIIFEGVVLNPGFTGASGKIIDVTFRVKKEGAAKLQFTEFAILANDGLGTNVASANGDAQFTFLPARKLPSEKTSELLKEDIQKVEQQIQSMTEKVESIKFPAAPSPISSQETGILKFWGFLPKWVKISILFLVGIAALILALIILIFGIILLLWLVSHIWRRREKFEKWLGNVPEKIKKIYKRVRRDVYFVWRKTDMEIQEDIRYTVRQIKHDIREAEEDMPLKKVLKDYWMSVIKIARYIFKRK